MTYEQPQGDEAKPTLVTGFELRDGKLQTPDLAALEALAEAAITPDDCDTGVWEIERRRTQFGILRNYGRDRFGNMWHAYVTRDAGDEHDAAFIAAANPATVLWLIREVKRLRESIAGSPDKAQRLVFALLGGE